MSIKQLAAATLFAIGASAAVAQGAGPDTRMNTESARSRAEVRAEAVAARANGDFERLREYDRGPYDPRTFASTLTRAEVHAEAVAARANGDLEPIREYDRAPYDRSTFASTLTRAEVLADAQIWREAGMVDFYRGEAGPDLDSSAYRRAYAKYAAMRSSPQFAVRVQNIARSRGESVLTAKPAAAQSTLQ